MDHPTTNLDCLKSFDEMGKSIDAIMVATPDHTHAGGTAHGITFPKCSAKGIVKMPKVKVHWYDGGLMLPRPKELVDGQMMGDSNGGITFIGTKGKIMTGCYGMNPILLPVSAMEYFNLLKV